MNTDDPRIASLLFHDTPDGPLTEWIGRGDRICIPFCRVDFFYEWARELAPWDFKLCASDVAREQLIFERVRERW